MIYGLNEQVKKIQDLVNTQKWVKDNPGFWQESDNKLISGILAEEILQRIEYVWETLKTQYDR